MVKLNILDKAIGAVAPGWGAARLHARARMQGIAAATAMYDGAARGARVGFRQVGGTSANTEIWRSLTRLRDVCRDLERNQALAGSCREAWETNAVGAGIIPSVVCDSVRLKKRVQDLVKDHLDTPAIDFEGRNTLYGLQSLMTGTMVRDGEVLVVRYAAPARLRLAVPFQVRVLEADYLDGTKHGPMQNGNIAFEGIEFDSEGRRAAYWLFDEHPGGGISWKLPTSHRVAAADVAHIYRVDRPGQARGIPWGAPVVVTQWDLHDYKDAERVRQKIAACYAAFWLGDAPKNLAQQVSGSEKSLAGTPVETIEPGMIHRLPTGTDIKFTSPPTVTGYRDVVTIGDREISLGYGVPYEIATGDLSNVSFISGRLGLLQFNRRVDKTRWHIVIPHGCGSIARWFLEAAAVPLAGPVKGVRLDWTPPKREMVDPKTEVPASIDAIRGGLSTRSEEQRKLGYDPEEIEAEAAAENERADTLKLRFDSDGRFPKNGGGTAPAPAADDPARLDPVPPAKPAA